MVNFTATYFAIFTLYVNVDVKLYAFLSNIQKRNYLERNYYGFSKFVVLRKRVLLEAVVIVSNKYKKSKIKTWVLFEVSINQENKTKKRNTIMSMV